MGFVKWHLHGQQHINSTVETGHSFLDFQYSYKRFISIGLGVTGGQIEITKKINVHSEINAYLRVDFHISNPRNSKYALKKFTMWTGKTWLAESSVWTRQS